MNTVSPLNDKHPLSSDTQELLSAWLDGEMSELEQVETLLNTSPEARAYLKQLQRARALYHSGRQAVSCNPEAMVGEIFNRIHHEIHTAGNVVSPSSRRVGLPLWWAAAAAALLILAAGGIFFHEVGFTPVAPQAEKAAPVGGLAAEEIIEDPDLAALLDENFADSTVLPDLWEDLPEEELLQYAALWEDETASPDGPEDSGLWWEQAEQLAAFFDSTVSGDPEFPVPQP